LAFTNPRTVCIHTLLIAMAQIFDCDAVTSLVLEWQSSGDIVTLTHIMEGSQRLVEAIVSGYDSSLREDLIQESYIKVQYAIKYFDPTISNLHNYLTTVIRNICSTYVSKHYHDANPIIDMDVSDMEELKGDGGCEPPEGDDSLLLELIVRNRTRFPSIGVEDIDDITSAIYYGINNGGNKYRYITADISVRFNYDVTIVGMVYNSTLAYMRCKFIQSSLPVDCSGEFNLLPDVREVLGDAVYQKLVTVFSGMTIKVAC
jgi:hypothetical protein